MSDQIFSLKKDEVFDLSKLKPGVKDWYIGVDWDSVKQGEEVDLDLVLIAVGADGKARTGKHAMDFLFYGNHGRIGALMVDGDVSKDHYKDMPYYITPDDRDGAGDASSDIEDDEAIFLRESIVQVESDISELRVFVTYHEPGAGQTLLDVSRIGFRVAPLVDGVPDFNNQVTFNVNDIGATEGAFVAKFIRNAVAGWDVTGVGEMLGGLGQVAAAHGIGTK
jgi:stress response protein SCP2